MSVFSATSQAGQPGDAARDIATQASTAAGALRIRAALAYCTVDLDAARFAKELSSALPGVVVLGTTTCQQLATDRSATAKAGALFLAGDGFRVGASAAADTGKARALGVRLGKDACKQAGFSPADARFAIVHATPGLEEGVLEGLTEALGSAIPVIGGSAADNDISGKWSVFAGGVAFPAGAGVLVCDWPWKFAVNYQGGYLATQQRGVVTRAEGRRVYTINGAPAAQVYQGWLGKTLPVGESVLGQTTLSPFGVARARAAGMDIHVLVHPERLHADGSISTFANVETGETLVLMESTMSGLIRRSAAVVNFALSHAAIRHADVLGQLIIYCAGCSLALGEEVEDMVDALKARTQAPFVMPFTFGEQGCITRGRVDHGNLMCSALLLTGLD